MTDTTVDRLIEQVRSSGLRGGALAAAVAAIRAAHASPDLTGLADLPEDPLPEHPGATASGICGVTQITGGTEWVCIRPVHAVATGSRGRGRADRQSDGRARNADRHHFVNRYPRRPRS